MAIFTYARVSTLDQNTDLQEKALKDAYPGGTYRQEKKSGTTAKDRDVLNLLLDMISQGDKLVVWKLDRLARNTGDLCRIVDTLESNGASLEILDQKIDTATATGKAFLQMLGVFAEFETNLRKERQLAGIAAAKAKGKHLGRRSSLTNDQKKEIWIKNKNGMNPTQLSKEYGVSRATIYNVLKENK
jgi:DNA invertase Pin-like site-specific DNA recombinase